MILLHNFRHGFLKKRLWKDFMTLFSGVHQTPSMSPWGQLLGCDAFQLTTPVAHCEEFHFEIMDLEWHGRCNPFKVSFCTRIYKSTLIFKDTDWAQHVPCEQKVMQFSNVVLWEKKSLLPNVLIRMAFVHVHVGQCTIVHVLFFKSDSFCPWTYEIAWNFARTLSSNSY